MISSTVSRLKTSVLSASTWYRAIPIAHFGTPFGTSTAMSRFCSVSATHHLIYLAANPKTALLEVQALVQSFHAELPLLVAPHKYVVFPITVSGIEVVDFGDPTDRATVRTSTQELTGDWRAHPNRRLRGASPIVRSGVSSAPTQDLGAALAKVPGVCGFLSPSAHNARQSNLIVFPHKVRLDADARKIVPL